MFLTYYFFNFIYGIIPFILGQHYYLVQCQLYVTTQVVKQHGKKTTVPLKSPKYVKSTLVKVPSPGGFPNELNLKRQILELPNIKGQFHLVEITNLTRISKYNYLRWIYTPDMIEKSRAAKAAKKAQKAQKA